MKPDKADRYAHITGRCFINAPFEQLQSGLLDLFLAYRLQPEIGLEGNCLWDLEDTKFLKIAALLHQHNLSCTLHAPFSDLAPGGLDPKIREVTREKLRRAFNLIPVFRPKSIVCHIGYDEDKHSYKMEEWLRHSLDTWRELIVFAEQHNTCVMFENTYETTPDIHLRLFEKIPSSHLRFCLDTGHLMAYAGTPWQLWLDALLPRLGQLHLHDNKGERDDHIAIGHGRFDFVSLFSFLKDKQVSPLVTLEPHSEEDLWLSLETIDKLHLFEFMP